MTVKNALTALAVAGVLAIAHLCYPEVNSSKHMWSAVMHYLIASLVVTVIAMIARRDLLGKSVGNGFHLFVWHPICIVGAAAVLAAITSIVMSIIEACGVTFYTKLFGFFFIGFVGMCVLIFTASNTPAVAKK